MASDVDKILEQVKSVDLNNTSQSVAPQGYESQQTQDSAEEKMKKLYEQMEAAKAKYSSLQLEFKRTEDKLSELYTIKEKEDAVLKDILAKVKVKSKTLAVVSKEENVAKLKSLVANGNERLAQLAKQWNEVQTPLLEEYKTLKESLSAQEVSTIMLSVYGVCLILIILLAENTRRTGEIEKY